VKGRAWDRGVVRILGVRLCLGPPAVGSLIALCVASLWESAPSGNPQRKAEPTPSSKYIVLQPRRSMRWASIYFGETKSIRGPQRLFLSKAALSAPKAPSYHQQWSKPPVTMGYPIRLASGEPAATPCWRRKQRPNSRNRHTLQPSIASICATTALHQCAS
jgi:hypothetical protein